MAKTGNTKLLESINADTAVVMLASVHWMNGLKFDLERIRTTLS
ncbi:MAG: hypothetical protein R2813_11830 [Flavobacteriales bacterium]